MSDYPVQRLRLIGAKLRSEIANERTVAEDAADEILRLRAENEKLHEQAAINGRLLTKNSELREENRLVGLQMDRMADEIEKLRAKLMAATGELCDRAAAAALKEPGDE